MARPATELIAKRTEASRTLRNADGSETTELFTTPVFYKDASGAMVPIELGFERVAGSKRASSNRAPVRVDVGPANDTAGTIAVGIATRSIALRPLGVDRKQASASAAPIINGRRADISSAFPGVDLRVYADARGASTFLVLGTPSLTTAWTFVVDAPGLTASLDESGAVMFKDPKGALVAEMRKPYAMDSTPDELLGGGHVSTGVTYTLGTSGKSQTVTVTVTDPDWLKSAVYPVYIDPTIYNPGTRTYGDAFANQGNATMNYGNYMRPDTGVYEHWFGQSPSPTTDVTRVYFKFDLSSLPNQVISADFRVYPYHQYYNAPTGETAYLRRVTSQWYETGSTDGLTWNRKPNYTTTGTVTENCVEGSACSFDVKWLVNGWLAGTYTNYGLQLDKIGLDFHDWSRLYSAEETNHDTQRPRLVVTYDMTPPAPPSTPDREAGSDSGSSNTDNVTSDTTPTFIGSAEANAMVRIYDGAAQVGSQQLIGGATAWSIKSSALTAATHTITAKATDAAGNTSSASGGLSVTVDTVPPATPSVPDLDAASDTGASTTDNITSDATPTFVGSAEAGARVDLYDGVMQIGTQQLSGSMTAWFITSTTLTAANHSIVSMATDAAGNSSASSRSLQVTVLESDVALVWPAEGSTLFATETLEVAGVPAGTTSVTYLVDGTSVGTSVAGPWSLSWDTRAMTDGIHAVQAQATTASGPALSAVSGVTVDNTLASTERLDIDYAAGRVSADEYAVNGVYAMEAPLALPDRYRAPVAAAPGSDVLAYLAGWDALSTATQDEITAFFSQPLRGSAYAQALYPATSAVTHPAGITDPCQRVEVRSFPDDPVPLGTKIECVRETAHFVITYRIAASGVFNQDDVVIRDAAGVPTIIGQYAQGLEDAYAVYTTDLGYDPWSTKVPVDIHVPPCGSLCGNVGDIPAVALGHPQVLEMAPNVGSPYYLAHHELFHVFQGKYVSIINPGTWLAWGREGLSWLFESTAEWAAGYVTRAGHPEDATYYADKLPIFLSRPDDLQLRHRDGIGGREYGAWVLHEYLNEQYPSADHNFVRRVLEKLAAAPSDPLTLIDRVLAENSTSLAAELPGFWRASYLLDYDDSVGAYASDVEAVWRASLARPAYPATNGDERAPARPRRDSIQLADSVVTTQGATVERGGARFIEFRPAVPGSAGTFTLGVSAIAGQDLDVQVLTIGYPDNGGTPPLAIPPARVCAEAPLPYDANGVGEVDVSLAPGCDYVVMIVTNTAALGSNNSFQWWARFDRQVLANSDWKVLHLWWTGDGGTPPAEPTGWLTNGFNEATWSSPVIRTDPYPSWTDIPVADFISSPGSSAPLRLTSEIWLAREQFSLSGTPQADASLRWTVDNTATIWINGHQLVGNAGSWGSISTVPVPAAWLQAGQNTIAVRVAQDNAANTWTSNPTMFQAELTLPAQAP